MRIKKLLIVLVFLSTPLRLVFASDHIDGVPSLELHEQVDLSDLYAYKTKGKEGWMTFILNLYPGVEDDGHFSSKVSYDILLEQLNEAGTPWDKSFFGFKKDQALVSCSFTDPSHHSSSAHNSRVTCKVSREGVVLKEIAAKVGTVQESSELKVFAGPRSDAFFITTGHFADVTKRQGFVKTERSSGANSLNRINVLSIALEVKLDDVFADNDFKGLYSVSAQSYTMLKGEKKVLDRVGRPEITNLSLHDFSQNSPLKRSYNQTPLSELQGSENYVKFQNRLISNISAYDKLDGVVNWSEQGLQDLADLLLDDALYFSLRADCLSEGSQYLSLERSLLRGETMNTCGGRRISDDIMNLMYGFYIGGVNADLSLYETGVSVPYQDTDKILSADFPHLAAPEKTGWYIPNLNRKVLNGYLKGIQE